MKRVLITATVQSHIAQFHKPLIRMLKDSGCIVDIAAKDNLAEKNGLSIDVADNIYNIPFSRSPKSKDNIEAYKLLKKIISDNKYDIIHCNTPMGGIVTRLAAKTARKNGTKVFYTVHGFHFYKGAPLKNWLIYYPIEKFFAKYTDKLITITREDYSLAKKHFSTDVYYTHGVGVDMNKYYPITDEEKYNLRAELGYRKDEVVYICTGELNKNKNQSFILDLFPEVSKEIPNIKLLLAGNGPYKDILENKAKKNGIADKVILLGYTTKLDKYLKASDYVLSASKREGMPLNIIEAMMTKKPVIACENRGHRELIEDKVNGFLVKQKDKEAFISCLVSLYNGEFCLSELENIAYKRILKYEKNEVVKELKEIYDV